MDPQVIINSVFWVLLDKCTVIKGIPFILEVSKDKFDRYLTQLLHSTTQHFYLPPIQRGQHHVFSAEHTTKDILSFMAQVQGLNIPREFLIRLLCLFIIAALLKLSEM